MSRPPSPWSLLVPLVAAFGAAGCDDGGAGAAGTELAGKRLPQLSPTEQEQLCDWEAAEKGGYGNAVACEGGVTVKTDADRAACLRSKQKVFRCDFPVAQYQACIEVLAADRCNLQLIGSDKNCAPLFLCSLDGG